MPPEDIDDLFRERLDSHATPLGEDLWARLRADAAPAPVSAPERLDQLFRQGLQAHATPTPRALWERLEDEHLRPAKRRPVVWWPMALAAAVALLLVAGGTRLWLGFPVRNAQQRTAAVRKPETPKSSTRTPAIDAASAPALLTTAEPRSAEIAANRGLAAPQTRLAPEAQKKGAAQATRPAAVASTAPKTRMSVRGPSAHYLARTTRQPDAATEPLPLVAHPTARPAHPARPTAADEQRSSPEPVSVVAANPTPTPVPEIVPAPQLPIPKPGTAGDLITVDVRTGGDPAARPAKAVSTALAALKAPEERRRLGGRLLQQAGHLVRGERLSLAEVTGLPENVTLRATVAGRSLTKSIQL